MQVIRTNVLPFYLSIFTIYFVLTPYMFQFSGNHYQELGTQKNVCYCLVCIIFIIGFIALYTVKLGLSHISGS
jgi:hypothetical protein